MLRRTPLTNAAAVAVFVVVALWTMSGLDGRSGDAIPGTHLGDNAAALWNVWWFTYALEHGSSLYRTSMLFAPYGTQLSLHTHATTQSLLAWPWTAFRGLVTGHNIAIACGLALNGIVTFVLARAVLVRRTDRNAPLSELSNLGRAPVLAPMVAGTLFALSAFVQARVLGHINLVHAWVLPLFALALFRLDAKPSIASAILVGLAAALAVYTDYYYALYAGIFALVWMANRALTVRIVRKPAILRAFAGAVLALILFDLVLIALIAFSGGTAADLGFVRISMRGVRNPVTVFWILLGIWMLCRFPFGASFGFLPPPGFARLSLGLSAAAVLLLTTAPLWIALARVVAEGEYTTQRVLWRSSPPGADALTLVLGHPEHLVSGTRTMALYDALGIDRMEQSLWLGVVPLILIVATRRAWWRIPAARFWAFVGALFFLLALGPFLRVAGIDTALPLPQAVLRYVPGLSNARIPGRAVVMVSLSVAMLSAVALEGSRRRARWLVAALMILETLPAPAPVVRLPPPDAVDAALRDAPIAGAVAELPVGARDGFGGLGQLDHRALVHQIWHRRPLVGGFVARLPGKVRDRYLDAPLLRNLLEISTPAIESVRLDEHAAREAAVLGIAFVVVNRDTFVGERVPRADLEHAGFSLVQTSGARELYALRPGERLPQ